ncbi:BMP family ABC transporter substrate-binding protein [Mesorhizobium sp. M7A.F.Ca.CA.001.13.2.1]|nr:BMP family ABC transporter substrate-binding protein [Mesorhizobium sp. M7A.F.Ca.CA.001.13.2.1]
MKKLLIALMTTTAAMSLAATAEAADKLKACWVYTGPIGDFGYSYQHDQGRLEVEKALGDKVETAYLENVSEGPDADRAFERLAREGCKIIFGTSFGFMDPEVKVAKKFPKVMFEHATGYKTSDNLGIYNARFYEGRYVLGQIAAKESKAGVAGYIVSFPIPEVVMGINSFMLGAQSINPNFKAKIVWVNSWFDPGKEKEAAKTLLSQGCDVICSMTDTATGVQVAGEGGAWSIGYASDMAKFASGKQLTSFVLDWTSDYVGAAKAVAAGTWKPEVRWDGLAAGVVKMAPYNDGIPADTKAKLKQLEADIGSGKVHPYGGELKDQAGNLKVAAGSVLADDDVRGMNWFVKGMIGKLS